MISADCTLSITAYSGLKTTLPYNNLCCVKTKYILGRFGVAQKVEGYRIQYHDFRDKQVYGKMCVDAGSDRIFDGL